jgi:O-antigen ligase
LLLAPGLILTVSRGAIGGAVIGIMVVLVLQRTRARPVLTRVLPLALVALAAFAFAPTSLQSRVTTFHPGTSTPGEYAIYLRDKYARDAHEIIHEHPWTGVGIGNYYAADSAITTTPVLDPHQVLLQQEAEGGYVLAAAFVLLIGGTLLILRRMREVDVVPAAAGVLIATAAHGVVDIYWVRGTPILGWLLVGMACGGLMKVRRERLSTPA